MDLSKEENILPTVASSCSNKHDLKKFSTNIGYSLLNVVSFSLKYLLIHYLSLAGGASKLVISVFVNASIAFYGAVKVWVIDKEQVPPFSLKTFGFVILRSFTCISSLCFATVAYGNMSIDTATSIIYLFPFTASVFGCIFLGESFSNKDKIKYGICLVGTIFICQPFQESTENTAIGYFASLMGMLSLSLIPICSKLRHKSVPKDFFMFLSGVLCIPVYMVWYKLDNNLGHYSLSTLVYLILISLFTLLGVIFFEKSMVGCDLSIIFQFEYTLLALTFCYNIFIFSNPFSWQKFVGAILIIGANMQNAFRALIN